MNITHLNPRDRLLFAAGSARSRARSALLQARFAVRHTDRVVLVQTARRNNHDYLRYMRELSERDNGFMSFGIKIPPITSRPVDAAEVIRLAVARLEMT